jgi:hypothetical protein
MGLLFGGEGKEREARGIHKSIRFGSYDYGKLR